jgi:hypothetical protein
MHMKPNLECGDLVADAEVAGDVRARDGQEAEGGEAVVDVHHNDILARGEVAAVAARVGTRTAGEATAVYPEHDRAEVGRRARLRNVGCLDVEEQAVLRARATLSALRAIRGRLQDLARARVLGRVREARGRVGVADAEEAEGLLVPVANVCVARGRDGELVRGGRNGVVRLALVRGLRTEDRELLANVGRVARLREREGLARRVDCDNTAIDVICVEFGCAAGVRDVVELADKVRPVQYGQ